MDKAKVREVFKSYKDAILNDRGKEAVKYLDSRTKKYYTEMLGKIKNADSTTVVNMRLVDKIIVLYVRQKASINEIKAFDGTSLMVFAFDNGLVDKNGVVNTTIDEIDIEGSFAKAQVTKNGNPSSFYFHFYKEGRKWKKNLTYLMPFGEWALQDMIEKSGREENDFLISILEAMTTKKTSKKIWHPIN